MQKNHFLLLKKFKNTESAQLCIIIIIIRVGPVCQHFIQIATSDSTEGAQSQRMEKFQPIPLTADSLSIFESFNLNPKPHNHKPNRKF